MQTSSPALALFSSLPRPQPDALLALISAFRLDTRPHKIDLGVGVYKNDTGLSPVMKSVKAAEAKLHTEQTSKVYLGTAGDEAFVDHMVWLALGQTMAGAERLFGVQTPGGGGALRLAGELYASAKPGGSIWIGTPTWPFHMPIFNACGLNIKLYPFYDTASGSMIFETMLDSIGSARPGDAILIHGCCHNPSGATFTREQWDGIISFIVAKQLMPIVDLAYHGLGEGLGRDAEATRAVFAACPEALLAYSCNKNFGMYRDRVGALIGQVADPAHAASARGNVIAHARASWSMPPDHGAAVVRTILDDPALTSQWQEELSELRLRLRRIRQLLVRFEPRLEYIVDQQGLFVQLPFNHDDVRELALAHGIYLAHDGRLNIAGLNASNLEVFARALALVLDRKNCQQTISSQVPDKQVTDENAPAA